MNNLISNISNSLSTTQDFIQTLLHSKVLCKTHYPIAVIHSLKRSKSREIEVFFKNIVNEEDITPEIYSEELLLNIANNIPEALQSIDLVAFTYEPNAAISYKAKNPNDYWKKIQNVAHIQASFDYVTFKNDDDICEVEFKLRELIRKRKEVHALKEVGFIWMAITPKDVSKVFTHYFHDNYLLVNEKYHIGWSDKLKNISMRNFICPPQTNKKENI
jgi:hypothetical protein